jgi:uncharacterized protein (TIGR02594 family)
MKHTMLLLSLLLLLGCNKFEITKKEATPVTESLIYSAWSYIGKSERYDRRYLSELLTVDPVTTEWCAAFVNSVLKENNIPTSDHNLLAKSFLEWGTKVPKEEIQKGDIVIFPRGNMSWQGHVGFYVGSTKIGVTEFYSILGGNQENRVSIDLYRASRAIGIRRYIP